MSLLNKTDLINSNLVIKRFKLFLVLLMVLSQSEILSLRLEIFPFLFVSTIMSSIIESFATLVSQDFHIFHL